MRDRIFQSLFVILFTGCGVSETGQQSMDPAVDAQVSEVGLDIGPNKKDSSGDAKDADADDDSSDKGSNLNFSDDGIVEAKRVAIGANHTCVLHKNGIRCWGSNSEGQAVPPKLQNPTDITASLDSSCAIDDSGVVCWGALETVYPAFKFSKKPRKLELGTNHICGLVGDSVECFNWTGIDVAPPGLSGITQLVSGHNFSCAVTTLGVKCWGSNKFGETTVPKLVNPIAVAAGKGFACAIDDIGLKCWGDPEKTSHMKELSVVNVRDIVAGNTHVCVLDADGIQCTGLGLVGQTTPPDFLSTPMTLAAGNYDTCTIDVDRVVCWGVSYYGQKDPVTINDPTMVASGSTGYLSCAVEGGQIRCQGVDLVMPNLIYPEDERIEGTHACVLANSRIYCWGNNSVGQTFPPAIEKPHLVSVDHGISCAAEKRGNIVCWGSPSEGLLNVPEVKEPISLSITRQHGCVIDGSEVKCWGDNAKGELVVPAMSDPFEVAVDNSVSCAVDGTQVKCWGDKTTGLTEVPKAISQPHSLDAANGRACVLDGFELVCWGAGSVLRYTPPELKNPRSLSMGARHMCVKDDEGIKCWQ